MRNTETVLLPLLATARSALLSPSRSPMATDFGLVPVAKLTGTKLLAEISPIEAALRKTETEFETVFAMTRSGLPSPVMFPMVMETGLLPVV